MAAQQRAIVGRFTPFFGGDVALRRGKKGYWRIEMVPEDALTLVDLPVAIEHVRKDPEVSDRTFSRFLSTGLPPVGTVVATALLSWNVWLVSSASLTLFFRQLIPGDRVKRQGQDPMVGIVQKSTNLCTLKGQGRSKINERSEPERGWRPSNWSFLSADQKNVLSVKTGSLYFNIPSHVLELDLEFVPDDLVLYRGWFGRVKRTENDTIVRLFSERTIVVTQDEHLEEMGEQSLFGSYAKGDLVQLTEDSGVQAFCYDYGIGSDEGALMEDQVGVVEGIRLRYLHVRWMYYGLSSSQPPPPPDVLDSLDVKSDDFLAFSYNAPGKVAHQPGPLADWSRCTISTASRVRIPEASAQALHGPEMDPLTNYIVADIESAVEVMWQDGNITSLVPSDLALVTEADEAITIYPGSLVCSHDTRPSPPEELCCTDSDRNIRPKRVGVVQSVDGPNLLALVRWCDSPPLIMAEGDYAHEYSRLRISETTIGLLNPTPEEASLYDCYAPQCLNPRVGDIVITRGRDGEPERNDALRNQVGCIIKDNLDATYEIRLGAALEVHDVQISFNDIICTIPSIDDDPEADAELEDEQDDMDLENEEQTSLGADRPVETSIEYADGTTKDVEMTDDNEWDTESDAATVTAETVADAVVVSRDDSPEHESIKQSEAVDAATEPGSSGHTLTIAPIQLGPLHYELLSSENIRHHYAQDVFTTSRPRMKAIQREHKILSKPAAIPDSIYIRSWESRLDLFRVLMVGPKNTPYGSAPFVFDIALPSRYPEEPPLVFFEHWTTDAIRLTGRCNPNLYTDGKVCLSLLGTWTGDSNKSETWVPGQSTILQVLVSILGLVLVAEPFYNEAGYDSLENHDSTRLASTLYSQSTYMHSRNFLLYALQALVGNRSDYGIAALDDILSWLYTAQDGPQLCTHAIRDGQCLLERENGTDLLPGDEVDGLKAISKGARPLLQKLIDALKALHVCSQLGQGELATHDGTSCAQI